MNKVGWIIFSVSVVLVLGGLVAWTRIANPPIDLAGVDNNSVIAASAQNGNIADHVTGSDAKKILFIEYGDYQCPGCGAAAPSVKALVDEYGDKITFIFRNFPLTSLHPNAKAAAATAEAAGLQGKFWQMHDMLYEKQNDWNGLDASQRNTVFNSYATTLGLNADTFNKDIASKNVNQKMNFDLALGKSLGLSSTPSFYLGGKKVDDSTVNSLIQGNTTLIKQQIDKLVSTDK